MGYEGIEESREFTKAFFISWAPPPGGKHMHLNTALCAFIRELGWPRVEVLVDPDEQLIALTKSTDSTGRLLSNRGTKAGQLACERVLRLARSWGYESGRYLGYWDPVKQLIEFDLADGCIAGPMKHVEMTGQYERKIVSDVDLVASARGILTQLAQRGIRLSIKVDPRHFAILEHAEKNVESKNKPQRDAT